MTTLRTKTYGVRRAGIATFELVIAIPLFLFLLALMINFGAVNIWKMRGEIAARDAAWRVRWPRTGADEVNPPSWPDDATIRIERGRSVAGIDALNETVLDHPVVSGPIPNGFQVNPVLDYTRGMIRSSTSYEREFPTLQSLGRFRLNTIEHELVDLPWSNAEMGIPLIRRRSLVIYQLPQTDQSLVAAFHRSISDLVSIPHWDALDVLERDFDARIYYGRNVNFYPRLRHPYSRGRLVDLAYCEVDPQQVYDKWIKGPTPGLVDTINGRGEVEFGRISELPRRMTNFFYNMYEAVKREIEQLTDEMNGVPPPTPERLAWIMQRLAHLRQIQNLEQKIQQLEEYKEQLDMRENAMKQAFLAQAPMGMN